jgi:hypothetical protein
VHLEQALWDRWERATGADPVAPDAKAFRHQQQGVARDALSRLSY